MGIFIRLEVLADQLNPAQARELAALCPVDIFKLDGDRLTVVPEEEDECTLCELCLAAAPEGAITIHKLYSRDRLVSRGLAAAGVG